jgi:hypothetical protein
MGLLQPHERYRGTYGYVDLIKYVLSCEAGEEGARRSCDGEVREFKFDAHFPLTYPTPLRYLGPFPFPLKKRERTLRVNHAKHDS